MLSLEQERILREVFQIEDQKVEEDGNTTIQSPAFSENTISSKSTSPTSSLEQVRETAIELPNITIADFKENPKERFRNVLRIALLQTIDDFTFNKNPNIATEQCLTKFGCKNLTEYLQYLRDIKALKPNDFQEFRNHSEVVFHYFILKFEALNSAVESVFGEELTEAIKPEKFEEFVDSHYSNNFLIHSGKKKFEDPNKIDTKTENYVARQINLGGNNFYYSTTAGLRSYQEDRYLLGESNISSSQEAPIKLQNHLKSLAQNQESGTAVVIANYCPEQILTIASCGDSRAVLFFVTPDNSVEWVRLTRDHNLNNDFERLLATSNEAVILPNKGSLRIVNKVDGTAGLNMSRSLGDMKFGKEVSSEPDIFSYNIEEMIEKREEKFGRPVQVFLMISSDGLYTRFRKENGEIGNINERFYADALQQWLEVDKKMTTKDINKYQKKYDGNIAKYLQDYALAMGSSDNITVIMSNITKPPEKPVIMETADSHNGCEAAKLVGEATAKSLVNRKEKFSCSADFDLKNREISDISGRIPSYALQPSDTFHIRGVFGINNSTGKKGR